MDPKINLKTPLQYLKGVGPERSRLLTRLGLETVGDLFYLFPRRHENRAPVKRIGELGLADKECVSGTITTRNLMRLRTGQTIFRAVLTDGKHQLVGMWFNQPYLHKVFLPQSKAVFYGQAEKSAGRLKMTHPEYEVFPETVPSETVHTGRIVPVYPLTEDLSQKGLRQLVYRALQEHAVLVRDPLATDLKDRLRLIDKARAIREIHFPSSLESGIEAYRRLVFEEFFLLQLVLERRKAELRREAGHRASADKKSEVRRLLESLEFELTAGQEKAVWEIVDDMSSGRVMNRLVQGDVGSGKTVVAAAALVFAAASGFQGAMMAPTEVLAQQLYMKISQLVEPLGISCAFLAQSLPPVEKEKMLRLVAEGGAQIVVGTHALIQRGVAFKSLGLAVIDEQHKFGVFQRAALKAKSAGRTPHFLVMTATPIPRTLAMTLYGDLDASVIAERPSGRQAVSTFWVGEERRGEVYRLLDSLIAKGGQAYVVCPLIEVQGPAAAKSVFAAHAELSRALSHRRFAVLHGKMKAADKNAIMKDFKDRKIDVLISTVVIEVGVDVPNANLMIIENAEMFGLAQLHQLRGRVGRGGGESFCALFSSAADEETVDRLRAFEETQSGFEIAEKDMALRGAGDAVGERQHGIPELRIGDIVKDLALLVLAKDEARAVIAEDPRLMLAKHGHLRRAVQERFGWKTDNAAVSA